MKLGVRGKLFAISLVLVAGVVLVAGLTLEPTLRRRLEARIELELLRHARAGRDMVEVAPGLDSRESADGLADRLGRATESRVTIIRADGQVLGDSEIEVDALRDLENHRSRPEVRLALTTGTGTSRRYSTTLRAEMLYVAVPYARTDGAGVVRVAMPLAEVDQALSSLRAAFLLAAVVGLVVAIVMSALASHFASRTLRTLMESVRAVSRGERRGRVEVPSNDELGRIARSFNQVTAELDEAMVRLGNERAQLEAILDGMSEAVMALDVEQRITRANSAALSLLGLTEEPRGTSLVEIVRAPPLTELIASLRDGQDSSAEFELPGPPPRRVLTRARTLRSAEGAILVMLDVTETRRLEAVRRDFVANVSHELRTPTSVIQVNAETLLHEPPEDPKISKKFLGAILRNAERLSRLVSDLLDLSRIESGQVKLDIQPISVREALRRVVEGVEAEAREKQQHVEAEPTDLTVMADERALDQILQNLVDNAVKYTPADGTVTLSARRDGPSVCLEVRDDGPGIEARHRERLFERFYRVDTGRSREVGGTGLGLAIVRHLSESMGGRASVDAAEPQGTVFRVVLPAPEG